MPQTRFVLKKSLDLGLKPIVVINKIDRPGADPAKALDEVFDLFVSLGANDEQLDFSTIYTSAKQGFCRLEPDGENQDMNPLLDLIVESGAQTGIPKGPSKCWCRPSITVIMSGELPSAKFKRGRYDSKKQYTLINRAGDMQEFKITKLLPMRDWNRLRGICVDWRHHRHRRDERSGYWRN